MNGQEQGWFKYVGDRNGGYIAPTGTPIAPSGFAIPAPPQPQRGDFRAVATRKAELDQQRLASLGISFNPEDWAE